MSRRASAVAYQMLFGRKATIDLQVIRSKSILPGKAIVIINENNEVQDQEGKGGLMETLEKFLLLTSSSENAARIFEFWMVTRVHGVKPSAKVSFDKFSPMLSNYKELKHSIDALNNKWDAVYGIGTKKEALTLVGAKGKPNGNGHKDGNGGNGSNENGGSGSSSGNGNGYGGTGNGGVDFNRPDRF